MHDRERATASEEAAPAEVMAEEVKAVAIPADVGVEMVRQHRRFGPRASRERWITVMTEELGEIARAYLPEDVENRPVEMSGRQELVQLTAIASERSMTGTEATTSGKSLVMSDDNRITDERCEVIAAGRERWRMHRPVAWTEDEHLAKPTVNIPDPSGKGSRKRSRRTCNRCGGELAIEGS